MEMSQEETTIHQQGSKLWVIMAECWFKRFFLSANEATSEEELELGMSTWDYCL